MAEKYSVNRLAKAAGVSVRTLHHYDELGLLRPMLRADSGYRYYGKEELLRLQQILLFKGMGLSLATIQQMLDEPGFDTITALEYHKQQLQAQKRRLNTLLQTVDRTILNLKNETEMDNYDELYKGFPPAEAAAYEQEVIEKYGKGKLDESKQKINAMTKAKLKAVQEESEAIYTELARSIHKQPGDVAVQELIKRHFNMMQNFFTCPIDTYKGIGELYVDDSRYAAFFEKYGEGLNLFVRDAIRIYCKAQTA
jgi:DNA-binding transcriptional MerR regulator